MDALRAVAILGVVLGHWMVSAIVSDPYLPSTLHGESPLSYVPQFAPASWFLQTLGLFFFAGGYAAARSRRRAKADPTGTREGHRGRWARVPRLGARYHRLVRPLLLFAAVWVPALLLLDAIDAPARTQHVVTSLVTHPLWFLPVYLALVALTTPLIKLVARWGLWSILPAICVVGITDGLRANGLPLGWKIAVTVIGWSVPYLLGIAMAENRLPRYAGAGLLALGGTAGALLVLVVGYPASAVGVPGDRWSNLDPPSLFTVSLAFAQLGVFLLLRARLAGPLRRPRLARTVTLLNRTAMELFCWHQTAMLLVVFAGLLVGRHLPGLLDTPDGRWLLHRLVWVPLFLLTLAGLVAVFHRASPRHPPTGGRTSWARRRRHRDLDRTGSPSLQGSMSARCPVAAGAGSGNDRGLGDGPRCAYRCRTTGVVRSWTRPCGGPAGPIGRRRHCPRDGIRACSVADGFGSPA
ncbi:acyltransferase family protein [Micromonospora matsumotoense]|uniref:acyltransferase family protein n=1 Tax=Micromonospora matsumotoense TaxID=121616 RepID=UPI003D8EF345